MEKRIAFLVYDTSLTGGAEVITKQLSKSLLESYNVTVISLFQEKETVHEGYEHIVISPSTKSITFHALSLAHDVKRVLKDRNIDILFGVTAGVNSVAALASRGTATKFVYVEHSNLMNQTYGKKHFLRQRIGARCADRIVTLTDRDKKNYVRILKVSKERITVIPNWFEGQEDTQAYDVNSKRIVTAGRLAAIKGYDTLLEVAALVFKQCPDWSWDIYGEGNERGSIEEGIREKKLEKQVVLKGNVSNLMELYSQYAMFVMCSYYEGIPLVLLEAQSRHLPLISFDCQTGPREIISNGINGCLIKERDIAAMAGAIVDLIKNPEKRALFAFHAPDHIDQFDKQVIKEKWVCLIEELCEENISEKRS